MLDRKTLEAIGGWKGYRVEKVEWPGEASRTLSVYLKPTARAMRCAQCGRRCDQVHDTTVRRVRDLPLFQFRVVLHVPRRRVWCPHCNGPRLEQLDWLDRYQRVTNRFADAVEQLLRSASVKAVATFFDLGWHTVKAIDKNRLQASLAEPDWSATRYLAMDEFALHKGYRYATVVGSNLPICQKRFPGKSGGSNCARRSRAALLPHVETPSFGKTMSAID